MGTSKCQRLEPAALVPVKKGTWDEGESKKEQVVLVNRACPCGRIRGETPNRECDREEAGRK